MDMKKLQGQVSDIGQGPQPCAPYPKVAPEPSMYWPSVLMMPFGPAPYLKMLTVPELRVRLG